MWQKIIYLGIAGGVGTVARYFVSGVVQRYGGAGFPLGTAAVNVLGCVLFGVVWAVLESRVSVSGQMRMVIFVGFFGGFTTFSSFAFETSQLMDEGEWLLAMGNAAVQNVLGIAAMVAGLAVGKMI